MSTAKCEIDLGGASGPKGVRLYAATVSGSTLDCNVTGNGSALHISIENYNKHALGAKIECESQSNNVEFQSTNGNLYSWSDSIFLKPRLPSSPDYEELSVDLQPACQNQQADKITVKINVQRITITAAPDVDEDIKVDVN